MLFDKGVILLPITGRNQARRLIDQVFLRVLAKSTVYGSIVRLI